MTRISLAIILAYVLDLILGDPAWLPHPVRAIGFLARKSEPVLRRLFKNQRIAGAIFAIAIIGVTYAAVFIIIRGLSHFNQYLGFTVSTFFIYTALAIKDLKVQSLNVYQALEKGNLDLARKNLSMIVGRDTHCLDDKELVRATVETVAENTVDGIISPLFYAFLGAAPLALAYKAASTLDSMVGYKNERYKDFGWLSAKIDDGLNFIPARLSALILPLASGLAGLDALSSFKIALRDRKNNPSPNSGIPESAMAGALGIKLGGLNFYNSQGLVKPFIGDEQNVLSLGHIKESVKVSFLSSLLTLIFAVSTIYIITKLCIIPE